MEVQLENDHLSILTAVSLYILMGLFIFDGHGFALELFTEVRFPEIVFGELHLRISQSLHCRHFPSCYLKAR